MTEYPNQEPLYMNGEGVMAETERLNDRAFDAVPLAVIGTTAGIMVPFLHALITLATPYDFEPHHWTAYLGTVILGAAIHYIFSNPWRQAMKELRRHKEAMEAQTRKSGKGWAQS